MATVRQKQAFKKVVKGSSLTKAMREVGYSETTSKRTNKLTRTKGWQELIKKHLSDEELAKKHQQLLNQKRTEYFVFPRTMEDEEIIDKVNSAGFEVIVIKDGDKGRYAFYSTDDAMAVKSALDMAYKLKGSYAPEKHLNVNVHLEDEQKERAKQAIKQITSGGDS